MPELSWKTRGVLLAGLGLVYLTSAAAAQSPRLRGPLVAQANGQRQQKVAQAQANQQLVQTLQVLRAVKYTLEKADHDYGGHRIKAIHDISAAQKQLRLALYAVHKKKPQTPGTGSRGGKTQRKPQALSNMQLAQSIGVLQQTIGVLNSANHDYGGHRGLAVRDLNAAIRQLQVALKYEKKKVG